MTAAFAILFSLVESNFLEAYTTTNKALRRALRQFFLNFHQQKRIRKIKKKNVVKKVRRGKKSKSESTKWVELPAIAARDEQNELHTLTGNIAETLSSRLSKRKTQR